MNSNRRHSENSGSGIPSPASPDPQFSELEALREENKQLRELVIQLSKIVVKHVVDAS
jgi:hypothetical protein